MSEQRETGWHMREAARSMRDQYGPEHERHEMWSAMADLLDMEADWADQGKENSYAVDVATTYLAALAAPVPSGTSHEEVEGRG